VPRLEPIEPPEHVEGSIVHHVRRIATVAGTPWQPAARPPAQGREMPRKELVERAAVSATRPPQQFERRMARRHRFIVDDARRRTTGG
jgi:hypothetical protein